MKENCNCDRCKHKVDEYFCISCGNNFNECETFFEVYESMTGDLPTLPLSQLCPKCHPKTWDASGSYPGFNIFKKMLKELPEPKYIVVADDPNDQDKADVFTTFLSMLGKEEDKLSF